MPIAKSRHNSRLSSALKVKIFQGHPLVVFTTMSLLELFVISSFCLYALLTRNNRHLPQNLISAVPSLKRYQIWGDQVGLSALVNDVLVSYTGCLFIHLLFLFSNLFILIYRYRIRESSLLNINKIVFFGMLIIVAYPNIEIIWGPYNMGRIGIFSNSLFSGNETLSYFRYAPLAFANLFLFVLLGGGLYRYPDSDWQSRRLRG